MSGPERTTRSRAEAKPTPDDALTAPWERLLTGSRHRGVEDADPGRGIADATAHEATHLDPVPTALRMLRNSRNLRDRNTAQAIDTGRVKVRYIQNPAAYPDADGFWDGEYINVKRNLPPQKVRETLIHEVNHALGSPVYELVSFRHYRNEFQAEWIEGYAGQDPPDIRARKIRAHILGHPAYPKLTARYHGDPVFKALVDAHTRPEGNVLNSLRYAAVIAALRGPDDDAQAVYQAIKLMSPEEKESARGSPKLLTALQDLTGYERQKAYLLLFGYPEHGVAAIDAIVGPGTDEEALFRHLAALSGDERDRLRHDQYFMALLRDDLSGDDLERVLRLLGLRGEIE